MKNVPQRQAYGRALAEYGDVNSDVVVLDADVLSSTLTSYFAQRHPTRSFNLGVTEASIVDVGVGFALSGMIPFVNTFAALSTLRACGKSVRVSLMRIRTLSWSAVMREYPITKTGRLTLPSTIWR